MSGLSSGSAASRFRGTAAAGDRGAAALEFALVVPVLLALVFGMIDYGLYFSDSLGARDGVQSAARQASVANFDGLPSCGADYAGSGNAKLAKAACLAAEQSGAIGGDPYALVQAPEGWDVGNDVLVCVAVVEDGVTGFTPLPNDSTVRTKIRMRIDQPTGLAPDATGDARRASAPVIVDASFWTPWCA